MSSVYLKRAPRGQARLELITNRQKIVDTASSKPNLKEVWKTLRDEGVITIAYPTFCGMYRKIFECSEFEPDVEGKFTQMRVQSHSFTNERNDIEHSDHHPPALGRSGKC